jgi:hypothetical protein
LGLQVDRQRQSAQAPHLEAHADGLVLSDLVLEDRADNHQEPRGCGHADPGRQSDQQQADGQGKQRQRGQHARHHGQCHGAQ